MSITEKYRPRYRSLPPATTAKDRGEKMELYQSQKLKYYLIVDAQFKKIEVCVNCSMISINLFL